MTTFSLSQNTIGLINKAISSPGSNNINYLNAYNAIYNDIKNQPGVDPGTVNWFSQAGLVNTQLFNATPAGTWIYNYMFAAAQSEGVTLNNTIFQQVSNTIATTVFKQIADNSGVFDTNMFSPVNIVKDDAGAGLGLLQSMFPNANLDYAIWGGTLFTSTILNDPSYYSTYSIDTSSPSTRDCLAIDAGFASAASTTAKLLLSNPQYIPSAGRTALQVDAATIMACMFGSKVLGSPSSNVFEPVGYTTNGSPNFSPIWSDIINTEADVINNPVNSTALSTDASYLAADFNVRQVDGAFGLTLNGNSIAELVTGGNQVYSADLTGVNAIYDMAGNNQITLSGQGMQGTASNDQINLTDGASATINGNANTMTAGNSDNLTINGSSNSTNVAGSGSVVNVIGSGGVVNVNATNNSVTASNTSVNLASGVSANLAGGNDNVQLNGTGDYLGLLGGSYSVNGAGATIATWANTTLNLSSGSGGSDTVNLGGAGNYVGLLGGSYSVNGAGATIATWANTTLNLSSGSGGSDTVNLGGAGNYVGLLGGSYSVNGIGTIATWANTSLNLSSGSSGSDTVNLGGRGNYVGLLGGSYSVNGSGATIATWANTSLNLSCGAGGSDIVNLGGTGDYLGLLGGAYSVTGSGALLGTWAGTSINLAGGSDTVNLGGTGDYLGLLGGKNYSVTARNATITTWANTSFGLSGGSDDIHLGGTGNYVGLLGGTNYFVTAQSSTIATWDNTTFACTGSGNSISTGASCATSLNGDGNVFSMASGSSLVDDGINNTINASGCEIVLGSANRNQTICIYGNNDYIDASAVSDYIHTTIEIIGTGNTVRAEADTINFQGSGNNVLGGYNNLLGSYAHQVTSAPPNLNTFPAVPVPAGDPGSGSTDPNGVGVYAVPVEPITVTPLPDSCPDGTDPIILNLAGGTVDTTSLAGSSALFDMQNNGQKAQTGWGTAGEGYLVYDQNDAGNTTAVTQDSQLVAGFGALQGLARQVDGSAGGSLTASDALWNSLKVWVDTTGTGQFQSGQLYSLSQLGITSVNLDGEQVNQNSNGNEILVDSTFTYANGSTGDIAGVNLMYKGGTAASASTGQTSASLADLQVSNLIAGMAAYGAEPAATSTLVAAAQQNPQAILAASLH